MAAALHSFVLFEPQFYAPSVLRGAKKSYTEGQMGHGHLCGQLGARQGRGERRGGEGSSTEAPGWEIKYVCFGSSSAEWWGS